MFFYYSNDLPFVNVHFPFLNLETISSIKILSKICGVSGVTSDSFSIRILNDNLKNFGDNYSSRRLRESEYLTAGRLEETLAKTAPADAPSRQLSDAELIAKVQDSKKKQ